MKSNPNVEIRKPGYTIIIFAGRSDPMDEDDDNVDVQIDLDEGGFYTATFFTLRNLSTLFKKNKRSGECSSGLYFFCRDMVIVEKLSAKVIEDVVSALFERDALSTSFDWHSNSEEC